MPGKGDPSKSGHSESNGGPSTTRRWRFTAQMNMGRSVKVWMLRVFHEALVQREGFR